MSKSSNWTAAAIALTLLALALNGSPARAQEKVLFGEQPALTAMVASVGIAKGYFREEGLEVSQVFGHHPTDTIPAAISGQIQFGFSGTTPIIAATANGSELLAIGLLSHGYSGVFVASKANAKLKTLADFRGKRIGVQRGSGVTNVFMIALERAGLSERDFQFSNVRVADMPAVMQSGAVDAVLGWEPGMSRIVSMGYGEVLITPQQFEELADVTYPLVLFTTKDFAKRRPDVVQKFMNGWTKAQHFAHTHHAESLQILRDTLGSAVKHTPDAELEALAYVYKKDRVAFTPADIKDFESMRDYIFKQGQIKTKPSIANIVDNSYALEAERKLKAGK